MNKTELIAQTAWALGETRGNVERYLNAITNTIRVSLSNEEVIKIAEFGTFRVRHRPRRNGVHPRTAQPIVIEDHSVVSFIPSDKLTQLVNEK